MDRLYAEISEKLFAELHKFKENKTTYENLFKLFEEEEMLKNAQDWEKIETNMKQEIFEYQNHLYTHLLEIEKDILEYQSLNRDKEIDINIKDLALHANMLSRNKEPPEGFAKSPWYLPCFPNLNMIEFLHNDDN
ncbi:hypothetical protein P3W45_001296 [Vairimorpha bombi]|jgi:phage anti-repressor protein